MLCLRKNAAVSVVKPSGWTLHFRQLWVAGVKTTRNSRSPLPHQKQGCCDRPQFRHCAYCVRNLPQEFLSSSPCRRNVISVQKQQKRSHFQGRFGGGHFAEEHHINNAYRKIGEKPPATVILCERVQLVGCNLLPARAQRLVHQAQHRFRVITHADTVSLSVLKHQLAYVEEQERRNNYKYPTAVFAMSLKNAETIKLKQMQLFADAIAGACSMIDRLVPVVVAGIPNSGKSSLVLTLTKNRTLKVKNKKEYHLPKVSSMAGRTLGTKSHVLDYGKKQNTHITFVDSPGLRPRLEELDPQSIRLMLAAKSVEPFKNYLKYTPNNDLLRMLLQAANNYTRMNYELGMMLRNSKKNTVVLGEEYGSPPLPDYAAAFGLSEATEDPEVFMKAYYGTTQEKVSKDPMYFARKFQAGDFGSWLFTPYRRDYITNENLAHMNKLRPDQPIIYMNPAALQYIARSPDFITGRRGVQNVQEAQDRHNDEILRRTS